MKALSGVYIPLFFIGFVTHHLRQILIFFHPGLMLPCFESWLPDPAAFACDAFSLSWRHFKAYAFPPFCLIPRVLVHVKRGKPRRILLVAPVWPSQSWYPTLLEMSVDRPILLPRWPNLLELRHNHQLHPLRGKLQLAAWILSGESSQIEAFHLGLLKSSVDLGHPEHLNNMRRDGRPGVAGAVNGRVIPFKHL